MIKIGSVCICNRNILGIVTKIKEHCYDRHTNEFYTLYTGLTFEGESWQSKCPRLISDTVQNYIDRCVDDALDCVNIALHG